MTAPLIEFENVTLGYGRNVVLRDLNFTVHQQDLLGIVGPNGTGKTTMLKGILGLLQPKQGRIVFHGTDRAGHRIGYVPQRVSLDDLYPLTALDVTMMGRVALIGVGHRARPFDLQRAREAMALVGLEDRERVSFRALSGGQKQRVLMARALATEATILILDEPTEGMDLPSETALVALIRRLHDERAITVVLVSHLLNMVANVALRLGILAQGHLRIGPTEEIFTGASISSVYGMPATVEVVQGRRFVIATESAALTDDGVGE